MEKIFITPRAKEIVFRGKSEDGHVDAFSYNYEGNAANSLGGLFIVGHVQPATEDTSYMVNLVASLAKREYYAQPDAAPKESFSKTLKKINEVLQDFFRNKDIKINIGIFAVAGENILISRLGKFKIILGRDGQNIDILNNVNLFNKEHIQEKEFSNIISGKIMPKDKIFAFYPGRSMVAREKNIKASLIKFEADDFAEKLNLIKKESDNFLCAGIHITIDKHTESEIITSPQPQELRKLEPMTVAVKTPRATKEKPSTLLQETVNVRPVEKPKAPVIEPASPIKTDDFKPIQPEIQPSQEQSNVYYPGNKSISKEEIAPKSPLEPEPSTFIRPSEFSSAKKANFLDAILKKYKPSGIYVIGQQPIMTKKKLIFTSSLVVVIAVTAVIAKLTFMPFLPIPGIQSEDNKATENLLAQINLDLETAQNYKNENNLLEARRTLLKSLSSIASSNLQDEDLLASKREVITLLDEIDKAVDMSPNLLYQISQEIGNGSLLSFAKDKILVYVSSLSESGSGTFLNTTESGIEDTKTISDFNPFYLIGGGELAVMINEVADQIGSLTIKSGDFKTSSLALSGSIISVYSYQDNLYILTSDGIYKITDATQGKSTTVSWLNEDVFLPIDPVLLAIDGKVYVLTKNGTLATYYKGNKESEVSTSIPVAENSALLTTKDSTSLYLVDMGLGRIYIINKTSGSLVKTLKLNSDQPLVSASMADNETIYLLTADNKVWKVVP